MMEAARATPAHGAEAVGAGFYLVPHTHWDREWYAPFQQYRYRLVKLMDRVLADLMAGELPCFWADGQMALWEDYLEVKPEAREAVARLSSEDRLPLGPWFIQLDEFLVDGELHIRNLLLGRTLAQRLGEWCPFGYLPDQFGHIAQMPQILRGFGISHALVWRGVGTGVQAPAFWWEGPDGSRVLALYLPEGYSLGVALPEDPEDLLIRLTDLRHSLAPFYADLPVLIMAGSDHTAPTAGVFQAAAELSRSGVPVQAGLPHRYVELLGDRPLPVVRGELRSPARAHLLADVTSARLPLKQSHWRLERQLLRYAEPLASLASMAGMVYPRWFLQRACRLLLENGFHDTICGTGVDQVYLDAHQRYAHGEQLVGEVMKETQTYLAATIDSSALPGQGPVVLAFNPTLQARDELVAVRSSVPLGDSPAVVGPDGRTVPLQMAAGHYEQIFQFQFSARSFRSILTLIRQREFQGLHLNGVQMGRPSPELLEIQAIVGFRSEGELDLAALKAQALKELQDPQLKRVHIHIWRSADWQALFRVSLPPLGWRALRVVQKDLPAASGLKVGRNRMENQHYLLRVDRKGRIVVLDKATGQLYRSLHLITDEADAGDEYNHSPLPQDVPVSAPRQGLALMGGVQVRAVEHGPVRGTLEIRATYTVPDGLDATRRRRSRRTEDLEILTRVSLVDGLRRIEFETEFQNRVRDHRLRVWFPTGITCQAIEVASPFGTVSRSVSESYDPTWPERPAANGPHSGYVKVARGERGLLLMARGLPEYAFRTDASGLWLGLTLVRAVGWLSRDDLSTRRGHAGPFMTTPGAQVQGPIRAEYALVVGSEADLAHAHSIADGYLTPPAAWFAHTSGSVLPAEASLMAAEPHSLAISCLKEAEDGQGWIVRIYNPEASASDVRLSTGISGLVLSESSMDERLTFSEAEEALQRQLGPYQIMTLRISQLRPENSQRNRGPE
jgi:alpha-mannosidase